MAVLDGFLFILLAANAVIVYVVYFFTYFLIRMAIGSTSWPFYAADDDDESSGGGDKTIKWRTIVLLFVVLFPPICLVAAQMGFYRLCLKSNRDYRFALGSQILISSLLTWIVSQIGLFYGCYTLVVEPLEYIVGLVLFSSSEERKPFFSSSDNEKHDSFPIYYTTQGMLNFVVSVMASLNSIRIMTKYLPVFDVFNAAATTPSDDSSSSEDSATTGNFPHIVKWTVVALVVGLSILVLHTSISSALSATAASVTAAAAASVTATAAASVTATAAAAARETAATDFKDRYSAYPTPDENFSYENSLVPSAPPVSSSIP